MIHPSIIDIAFAELRSLKVSIDVALRDAYGWQDLELGRGFHEVPYLPENERVRYIISEPARLEVLRRLSKLNKERWEAEQRAAGALSVEQTVAEYAVKPKRKSRRSAADAGQPALPFAESDGRLNCPVPLPPNGVWTPVARWRIIDTMENY